MVGSSLFIGMLPSAYILFLLVCRSSCGDLVPMRFISIPQFIAPFMPKIFGMNGFLYDDNNPDFKVNDISVIFHPKTRIPKNNNDV
jgi:hypothetical protein